MQNSTIDFSIKKLDKASDSDYIKSLQIYTETTPVDIKTNSNEITYWLNKDTSKALFIPMYFSIYCGKEIIGFAMMTYLKSVKTVVIEYMAFIERFRINSVFFPVLNLLFNYLEDNHYDVDYYINEISNKHDGKSVDKESKLFKKMICMEGFGKIDAKYYAPPLGTSNYESCFEAYIYIKTKDNISSISKETYLSIIKSIYYEYFYAWYIPFLTEQENKNYKIEIDKLFESIVKSISDKKICDISLPQNSCPLTITCELNTSGTINSRQLKRTSKFKLTLIFIAIIIIPVILLVFYSFALKWLGIEINSVNSTLGGILSALISSFISLIIYNKRN